MGLNFRDATFGRDATQSQAAIDGYRSYFTSIQNELTGEKKEAFVNALKNSWTGSDCDVYLSKLESRIQELTNKISKFPAVIESAVNDDVSQFNSFQNSNANTLK